MEYDPIPIGALKCAAEPIPVRIKRRNGWKAGPLHPFDRRSPHRWIGKVEDQEVFSGWRAASHMSMRSSELEMVRRSRGAEHDAIKSFMVFELKEDTKSKSIAIETNQRRKAIGRACYAKLGYGHGNCFFQINNGS
ncbi:hypothetical protein GCM10011390_20200 [Aureimonas endophytica]|uniref:Uncharacterized protein n=1 Tax=Aureimonas endophytica TaxID=2027858 RepID=A0A916ZKY8_9HYPH|nr:hypothetical protein GCM10011390_20200 [Aureimonas endophytica]